MTDEQREQIVDMRRDGVGPKEIAEVLGLSENTVKTFVRRCKIPSAKSQKIMMATIGPGEKACKECGAPVKQYQCRKAKMFCSDKCRMAWWNRNLDQVERKANYDYECAFCKKPFTAYGDSHRKYCCHECYIADRFGGDKR